MKEVGEEDFSAGFAPDSPVSCIPPIWDFIDLIDLYLFNLDSVG